jgi:DNA-binding MarR family transcriptional regulator
MLIADQKKDKNNLPEPVDVEKLAKQIRELELTYITSFADATNRFIDIVTKKGNDSRSRWGVMSCLIVYGGMRPTDLARRMFRPKHSITLVIDQLERLGFVVREPVKKDRRQIIVRITKKGIEEFASNLICAEDAWQPVISCLDKDEIEILKRLMRKMRRTMASCIFEKSDKNEGDS